MGMMNGNLVRLTLKDKKWQYRGEGNANLVLSLPNELKIVRFRKAEKDEGEEDEMQRICREAVFCQGVMTPLLGKCYVGTPSIGHLDFSELRHLEKVLRDLRPSNRHHKGLYFGHAMLYPDFALLPAALSISTTQNTLPTFCVEVKPKQGWLPICDRRFSKCQYCLNQFLKLKNGVIQCRSHYCPLDLFSGNMDRMKLALQSLLVDPQNNLKIFQDGVLVYGENAVGNLNCILRHWFPNDGNDSQEPSKPPDAKRLEDKFCNLVLEALSRNLASKFEPQNGIHWDLNSTENLDIHVQANKRERLPTSLISTATSLLAEVPACNWTSQALPQDCILARILAIQQLENNGTDYVYQNYCSNLPILPSSDYAYVDELLKSNCLNPIQRYLLATTAKDCSVMMAFQRLVSQCDVKVNSSNNDIVKDLDFISYQVRIGVSDLDPKPMSCIEKHMKRDHDVLIACIESLQSRVL